MSERQLYAEITPYFALNEDEVAKLKSEAQELRTVIDNPEAPWAERTRAEARLSEIERLLTAARSAPKQRAGAHQTAARNAQASGAQYLTPVPYWEATVEKKEPEPVTHQVSNTAAVQWPETFSERAALVQAAMAELRRIKAAE
jgi:hypothetical protein